MSALIKDLRERHVFRYLLLYIGVCWGLVEFLDFIVNRYVLSPALTDFALLTAALLLPSVLLIAYHHGRPGADDVVRSERIGVPVNLAVAAAVLTSVFWGKDLGAVTTTVTVADEEGNEVQRVIPKASFRRRLALFNFDLEGADSSAAWLQYALPRGVTLDLTQDQFIDFRPPASFKDRLREAGFDELTGVPLSLQREISEDLHRDHFLTGTVSIAGDTIRAVVSLYRTDAARMVAEHEYAGTDPLALADEIAAQLRVDLEVPNTGTLEGSADLPVSEILTSSPAAFRAFAAAMGGIDVRDDYEAGARSLTEAVELDPSFALANWLLFQVEVFTNRGAQAVPRLQAAMEHLYRLPERMQFGVKADYYMMVRQDADRAFTVLIMCAELFPDDIAAHQTRAQVSIARDQKEEAIASLNRVVELDPGQSQILPEIGGLYESLGMFDEALDYYFGYLELFPDDAETLLDIGDIHQQRGDHEEARAQFERAMLLEPTEQGPVLRLAGLDLYLGEFSNALAQYEEALAAARTAQERAVALNALADYYELRGQISLALDYAARTLTEREAFQLPFQTSAQRMGTLRLYVKAGRPDEALRRLESLSAELSAPFDQLAAIGALQIHLEMHQPARAEEALIGVEELIRTLGAESLRQLVVQATGRIHQDREEWSQSIEQFRQMALLNPTDLGVHISIGRSQRELGELDAAAASIGEVLLVRPGDPFAHYELALVLEDQGSLDEARQHLERALTAWESADASFEPAARVREALARLGGGGE
jgi:tetratricopeptide (TPR) repeat protein